ncbi:DUF1249 domain-containing protein [Sediminicurvatus halobius]|uniref:DUF1249 domain-containing protein n=1 Tax=Sediminicurvatus halobius TaxID=2182432 RepID=A0A2U2N5Y8_9GAMM|nr:DUF1249 domain-containing protein [Spiribacter halobius]PWG64399.1 DUF1249 domain-containing protein [Spiribacter halobius]UEX79401.1 DUF1249 domain-containing protein [Spiribacter halobius]
MMLATPHNPLESQAGRSFAALMELYENNYIFLRRLIPDVDRNADRVVSSIDGSPDLHLEVTERCAYTTNVILTHRFDRAQMPEVLPDLRVRIYHDARVAEVLPESSPQGFGGSRPHALPERGTLAWRWEVNRFLNRWLRYCLGEGHAFPPEVDGTPAPRPEARRWAV